MRPSWLCLIFLAGCHTEPFQLPDNGTSTPFDPGPPPRLTMNRGDDEEISFTPDGELLYTVSRTCFAFVPAGKVRAREWRCPPEEVGISDGYRFGAVSPGERIAFQLTRFRSFSAGPFYQAILVARLDDLRDSSEVTPVPFVTPVDGVLHQEIRRLAWLRGDTLAILADDAVYLTDPDNPSRPRSYVRLPLPGQVSSIQSRGGALLYLHLRGDSRVLAWDLRTSSLVQVHDFGVSVLAFAVGASSLAAHLGGVVERVELGANRRDSFPSYGLTIGEMAMAPDGSDIVVSARNPGPTSDLYRLKR